MTRLFGSTTEQCTPDCRKIVSSNPDNIYGAICGLESRKQNCPCSLQRRRGIKEILKMSCFHLSYCSSRTPKMIDLIIHSGKTLFQTQTSSTVFGEIINKDVEISAICVCEAYSCSWECLNMLRTGCD